MTLLRCSTAVSVTLAGALFLAHGSLRAQSCLPETECRFEKPNVLIVMDYSSSMATADFGDGTRWEAQVDAVRQLLSDTDTTDDLHVALTRFGYDPSSATSSTVSGDTSEPPITDGFAIDIGFDDASGDYLECNAGGVLGILQAIPPPPAPPDQMGTWTRGALENAGKLVDATKASHPEDENRLYEVVLLTDGDWNCRGSLQKTACDGDPAGEWNDDPVPIAEVLAGVGIRVHVVAFGDATSAPALDALAAAGGTDAAIDAGSAEELTQALGAAVRKVKDAVVVPECVGGLPRVMILMDASSSMLVGTSPGESNWDKARFALAGNPLAPNPGDPGFVEPLFNRTITVSGHDVAVEDVVHIGLAGYNDAFVQRLMLQYAPCARDNIAWSMDPYTSCSVPGCIDPYTDSDATLTWTFKNSDVDRLPPFVDTTMSFMPNCNSGGAERCLGAAFNTYTGEGLAFVRDNVATYTADTGPYHLRASTPFVNILVTDGQTSPDSTDPVPILQAMAAEGVTTHVIGFGGAGDLDVDALTAYAVAGGTGAAITVDPAEGDSADALAERLAFIIAGLDIDVCCQLNDCSAEAEPVLPLCGNGVVDIGEACDAGEQNGALGGSCSRWCHSVAFCGDGTVNGGEICDDANTDETDGCRSDCSGFCGDGIIAGAEGCDDANTDETDGCHADCTADADYRPPGSGGASGSGASGSGASGSGANGSGANGSGANGSGANGAGASGSGADGSGADGSGTPDGGVVGGAGYVDEGTGCGCRVFGRHARPEGLAFGMAIGFGIAMARRRRRT